MIGLGSGRDEGRSWCDWMQDEPVWKADVLPLDEPWRGGEPARAMLVVRGKGGVALHKVLRASHAAEPAGATRVLAKAVHQVARNAGGYPERLVVRDRAVAARLEAELRPRQVDVVVAPSLPDVASAVRRLARLLDEPESAENLFPVDAWLGPTEVESATFFAAAARFWRARPWDLFPDDEAMLVRWKGHESVVVLNRPRGHGHVFTLFTSAADYRDVFGTTSEPVLGVRYSDREGLPRELRRVLLSGGWEVADEAAWPLFMTDGSSDWEGPPGSKLTLVSTILAAVTALAESGTVSLPFYHAETGIELRMEADFDRVPWPRIRRAGVSGARGPHADPAAALGGSAARDEALRAEMDRVGRFEAHVRRPAAWTARHVANARDWSRFLGSVAQVPAQAATEYDLRTFLYGWYPRNAPGDDRRAELVPASLRHYFAWLAESEGIEYPWAAAVLRERPVFLDRLETVPLGQAENAPAVREWRGLLHTDLDARVMLHDRGFPAPFCGWDPPPSAAAAALSRELQRRWLIWRDEAVRLGTRDLAALRAGLVQRQREWERTTHPEHGASPLRVAAEGAATAG